MQKRLEQEILKLNPNLSLGEVEEKAKDILEYWIDGCLQDVLEADGLNSIA